jgi:hypothetical protein
MRVTSFGGTALNTALPRRAPVYQKADEPAAGRELILRPEAAPAPGADCPRRPYAPFLAQLLAKAENMPSSRARRRADPAAGADAYRAVAELGGRREGKSLRVT